MMLSRKEKKFIKFSLILIIVVYLASMYYDLRESGFLLSFKKDIELKPTNKFDLLNNDQLLDMIKKDEIIEENVELKDWHDYKFIEYEKNRSGPGENGEGLELTDENEIKENLSKVESYGFYLKTSEKISVNRSVPDTRIPQCKERLYMKNLPITSVIVIFCEEALSVLLRTVHSIVNRSPPELLHEVIMVNDFSNKTQFPELYEPLQKYIKENFPKKVKLINLEERNGLIVTRLKGAEAATGEVLVFLDSHIEVNVNWLPPLIEPIAKNKKVGTVPELDHFNWKTFQYFYVTSFSGLIQWDLGFKWNFKEKRHANLTEPYAIPIMLGCAFAINREYFWELGGYDRELKIWNGENYELSWKLWLCGDGLLQVPCSRVAHTFRNYNPTRNGAKFDYVGRNFKRVALVWMDEFAKHVFERDPQRFEKIDEGDLTIPMSYRSKCKPFRYFLEHVAPEFPKRYPPSANAARFASGTIKSVADPRLCFDNLQQKLQKPIGLYECDLNSETPKNEQSFILDFHRHITRNHTDDCVDYNGVILYTCEYYNHTLQLWKYDTKRKWLISANKNGSDCITANLTGTMLNNTLYMSPCNLTNQNQKWEFGYVNETAMKNYENIYEYPLDF